MSIMPYPALSEIAKYGYLGVELFFMISGFVIVLSVKAGNLRQFAISRAVRLYPALWACCTITFIVIKLLGEPRYTSNFKEYVASMTLTSEFLGISNVESAYWSIFVEIKFYMMVGILLLLKQHRHLEKIFPLWLLTAAACELAGYQGARKLLLTDYAAYFVAGANFYWIWTEGGNVRRHLTTLAALLLSLKHSIEFGRLLETVYSTPFSTLTIGTLIIAAFITMHLIATKRTGVLGRVNWAFVGALTYPLYLLHQTIGFIIFNTLYPTLSNHTLLWTTLALMLVSAWLIHRFIEQPVSVKLKLLLISTHRKTVRA